MGKITGFLEIDREDPAYEPASDRIRHYREFIIPPGDAEIARQAARCMDCGIPYCHTGCRSTTRSRTGTTSSTSPTGSLRPQNLHSTNNFPK